MKRVSSTEWETENVLPVSFAPLLPLSKGALQEIEICEYINMEVHGMLLNILVWVPTSANKTTRKIYTILHAEMLSKLFIMQPLSNLQILQV